MCIRAVNERLGGEECKCLKETFENGKDLNKIIKLTRLLTHFNVYLK